MVNVPAAGADAKVPVSDVSKPVLSGLWNENKSWSLMLRNASAAELVSRPASMGR